MATISYFDIWKVSEKETLNDEDLLSFAKGLFQDGFITVSTIYDEELNKNVTRYDITAAKIVKAEKKEEKKKDEKPKEEKNFEEDEFTSNKSFFRRIFSK